MQIDNNIIFSPLKLFLNVPITEIRDTIDDNTWKKASIMEINKIASTNTVKSGFAEMNNPHGNSGLPAISQRSAASNLPAVYHQPTIHRVEKSALPPSGITKTEAGRILRRISRKIKSSNKADLGNTMNRDNLQRIRLSIARHSNHINITRSGLNSILSSQANSSSPATVYKLDNPIAMSSEAPTGRTVETPEVYIEFVDGVMLKITRKPEQAPMVEVNYDPQSYSTSQPIEPVGFEDAGAQAVQTAEENFQMEFDIAPDDENAFYKKMVKEKYSQQASSVTLQESTTTDSSTVEHGYEEEYELIIPGDLDPDSFTFNIDETPPWVVENPFGDNSQYESPFGDNTGYESPFGNNDDSVKFALTNNETLPDILKELLGDTPVNDIFTLGD